MRAICFKPGFKESEILEKKIDIGFDEYGNFYRSSIGAKRPEEEIEGEKIRYSFYDTPFTPSSNIQMTPHNASFFMSFTPQYTPNHNNIK